MIQALLEILRQKKRLLLCTGLALLLNIGLLVWIDGHQSPAIVEAQLKWNDLRRRIAAVGRVSVEKTFKQGKSDLENLKGRIPLKRQFPQLLGEILDAASSSGLSTGNITYKPQTIKDEKQLLSYGVTLSVRGKYAAIKSFLADLLSIRELVVIDSFSLNNSDAYEENVTMDLRLTVYLREGA